MVVEIDIAVTFRDWACERGSKAEFELTLHACAVFLSQTGVSKIQTKCLCLCQPVSAINEPETEASQNPGTRGGAP